MITELLVGDRVLIDGDSYYINQVKNDDMGIYEARNISNNIVQVNIKNIGRYIHIDEEYNTIVRNMHEVMSQDIMTENKNYCYRYGILNDRLYRLTAYIGSHDYWNENCLFAHSFPEEVYSNIDYDDEKYVLADYRIFWIRAGKHCNGKKLSEIKEYMVKHPEVVLVKKPSRKNNTDFIISVHNPIFQRYTGNEENNTFDIIRIEMFVRSYPGDMLQRCKDHRKEILDSAINKLRGSKSYRKFGVPINFLKLYDMVLTKDNCVIISFCLKIE